jgi:hypothetical protein
VVVAVDELLAEFGSVVVEETVAIAEITVAEAVPEFTLSTTANVVEPLVPRELLVQLMEPVVFAAGVEQSHPAGMIID